MAADEFGLCKESVVDPVHAEQAVIRFSDVPMTPRAFADETAMLDQFRLTVAKRCSASDVRDDYALVC